MFDIFFYPANGVPYDAYAPLLSELSMHRVRSFDYLPLQNPTLEIPDQLSWDALLPPIDSSTMSSNHLGWSFLGRHTSTVRRLEASQSMENHYYR